jgi:hypothetical protein
MAAGLVEEQQRGLAVACSPEGHTHYGSEKQEPDEHHQTWSSWPAVARYQNVLSILSVEAHRESLATAHKRHLAHRWSPLTSAGFEAPVLLHRRVWHLPFGCGRSVATPGSQQDDPAIPGRHEFTPRSPGIPSDPTH